MKNHSTGALTAEEHEKQDQIYAQNSHYDVVIVGTGVAALSAAALLAQSGKKVCMLEAHDIPGGYAHSFQMGDFSFCAQIHYVWGCGPGDSTNQFLKKLGLENELTFEVYDANGYDHMVMPDGKRVAIPYGFDKLAENIEEAYPGNKESVQKFLKILKNIHHEERIFPSHGKITFKDVITKGWKFRNLVKYRNKTLQQVFDECKLSKEVQAILIAQAGDMMSPPEELSILAFAGLFGGYNTGAYYPTKHFKYYIERLTKFITDYEGCHIFYETPVSKINTEGEKVTSVETENGKTFTAETYICGADPQNSAKHLIGWDKIPQKFRKALSYEYAPAGIMMYLGVKDLDLKKHGFGSFNIWHLEQWDMNKMWKEQLEGNFENPWMFISTATLHTPEGGVAPEGMEIMEVATLADYESFRKAKDEDPKKYREMKMKVADKLLDLIEEKYIPNFREHIALKVVGSSTTNEDFVRAPFGTAYGSKLTPEQMGIGRLKADTPFSNLFWCNASSGFAGFHGTTSTGMNLYMKLSGDHFFKELPDIDVQVAYAKKKWEEQHPEVPITK